MSAISLPKASLTTVLPLALRRIVIFIRSSVWRGRMLRAIPSNWDHSAKHVCEHRAQKGRLSIGRFYVFV